MPENTTETLRIKLNELMEYGTCADLEQLEQIYHDDLVVMDIDHNSQLTTLHKQDVLGLIGDTFANAAPGQHMWADVHSLTVNGNRGHVLLARKLPFGGVAKHVELSIDFIFQEGRWQVIREVNFSRPDSQAA